MCVVLPSQQGFEILTTEKRDVLGPLQERRHIPRDPFEIELRQTRPGDDLPVSRVKESRSLRLIQCVLQQFGVGLDRRDL